MLAHEVRCLVRVDAEQIQGTETRIYRTLEQAIYTFMNGTRWTTDIYKSEELINCNILIILSERISGNIFKGSIQISSGRPVYKSGYSSTMFNHKDDNLSFTYNEYDPIEFNPNSYVSNLSSVLAFYAYMILGFDYDSFELNGGSKYYDMAQKIVNNAQTANSEGWRASVNEKNRYEMAQQYNDQFFSPIRSCIYKYHREGLDIMHRDVDEGRKAITEALIGLEKVHQARPSSFAMQIFFNAKSKEVIQIYSEAPPNEKAQVAKVCKTVDPGNAAKYDAISKNN
jgi:hypothetical protein